MADRAAMAVVIARPRKIGFDWDIIENKLYEGGT